MQIPDRLLQLKKARWLWMPLVVFFTTRIAIAAVVYISMPLITDSSVPPYHIRPDNQLLDAFGSRWDTGFYLSIAEEGYRFQSVTLPSVAFFPLLPMLMRPLAELIGDYLVAGLLISNLALAGACIMFYRLVQEELGESVADRAVWYFMIFPASLFGSAIYSESIFLLCAISALYLFRRGSWMGSAVLAIFAAASRLMGLLVAPLLFVEWIMLRRKAGSQSPLGWPALLAPLAALLGTGAYMLFLAQRFGDPLAFMHASQAWGRQPTSPLVTLSQLFQPPAEGWWAGLWAGSLQIDNWIDFSAVLLFVCLGVVLLLKRRWSESVYVLFGALLPFSSGLLMSQRRYMWVLFPAFIMLARWGDRPWVDRLVTALSLTGLGLATAMFANWYWVA